MNVPVAAICAALGVVPVVGRAQHGGHGAHGSTHGSGHEEPVQPRPRRDPPRPEPRRPSQIYVLVDDAGSSPNVIPLEVGETTEIVVMRTTEATCAKEIIVPELSIHLALPLEEPVRFSLKPAKPGPIHVACGLGHVGGDIVVR